MIITLQTRNAIGEKNLSRAALPIVSDMKILIFSETGLFASKYACTFCPGFWPGLFLQYVRDVVECCGNCSKFVGFIANIIMNLSAIEHNNNTQQRRQTYVPASVKVIELTAQRGYLLSASNFNNPFGGDEEVW